MKYCIRSYRWHFLLVLVFILYIFIWVYIVLIRYFSLNATVYDLGTAAEGLYLAMHPNMQTNYGYLQSFLRSEFTVFLSPLSLLPNITLFLIIIQCFLLAIPIFAIYKICKILKLGESTSVLISILYLFYPPLSGVNWFDFHFQALFIPLFLFGYLAYISNNLKASFVLFILSGMVRFPYMGFIILLAIIEIFYQSKNNSRVNKLYNETLAKKRFIQALLFVSLIIIIITFFVDGEISNLLNSSHVFSNTSSSIPISIKDRIETIILVFIPLLFIPLLSKRWILFYLPFLLLAIFSSSFVYDYPFVFRMQYSAMFIPFIFLGLIDVLANLNSRNNYKNNIKPQKSLIKTTKYNSIHRLITIILILLVISVGISASYMEPYGPYNQTTQESFQFFEMESHFNYTQYQAFEDVAKLIPKNAEFVLMQNNMPQLLPRPVPITIMDTGTLTTFGNITNRSISLNQFPYFVSGKWINVKINYLLLDPWSSLTYSTNPMISFFDKLYSSGLYGIIAEDNGFILLVRGYEGPLELYKPITYDVPLGSLGVCRNTTILNNKIFFHNSKGDIWWGPYINLVPGHYNVTVTLSSTNTNRTSFLILQMAISTNNLVLGRRIISGYSFNSNSSTNQFTFSANLTIATNNIEFTGTTYPVWDGELKLSKILLKEVAPPKPTTM